MKSANLNFGMHQLITQERERLGARFVCGYEIWQDESTVLPGYEGYAHFETERGYPLLCDDGDSFQMVSQAARNYYPSKEKKEEIFAYGYEFISIMKLAALAIGTAAVYEKPSFTDLTELFPSSETDLFWQHTIQSWIALGIASDRLRTYFIHLVRREVEDALDDKLGKQLKKLKGKKPDQYIYKQAFLGYEDKRLPTTESLQRLNELKRRVEDISCYRLKRNKIVHEYASREAMVFAAQRDDGKDHADIFKALNNEKHAGDYTTELADAYKVLSHAGNLVFSLEKDITEYRK